MPMFETPKPKQFRYKPRFYDPEKERWEALKQKYADQKMLDSMGMPTCTSDDEAGQEGVLGTPLPDTDDRDLAYFEQRVRELDREKRSKLTWKDMFRKREMPKFHYQPRFATGGEPLPKADEGGTAEHLADFKQRGIKIKRRFGNDDPADNTLKPIPAGRIMLYAMLVTLLLYWIMK